MTERVRLYTVDEFEELIKLPENRDRLLELIDGEIIEKAMPTEEHGNVVQNFSSPIHFHLKKNRLGRGGPEIRYRIPDNPRYTLLPDWSFRLGIESPPVVKGAVQQMPDFALEVQSPDEELADLRARVRVYLRNGTKLVVLVLPRQRILEVYWADGYEAVLTVEDTLDFRDLLPGFTLSVRDIFDL